MDTSEKFGKHSQDVGLFTRIDPWVNADEESIPHDDLSG
jgi:hypothetical protein